MVNPEVERAGRPAERHPAHPQTQSRDKAADLAEAIQAARKALGRAAAEHRQSGRWWRVDYADEVARIAAEAAWSLLDTKLRAAHAEVDRHQKLLDELIWVADFGREQDEYCRICHGPRPDHRDGCFIQEQQADGP